jgi:enamine deaminase RidA (YjgF/YER057c/UK114 family)
MTEPLTSRLNSLVTKLTRRNTLLWLGGTGLGAAFVAGTQKETIAKTPAKKQVQLINPPTLYDSTRLGFSQIAVTPAKTRTVYISGQYGSDLQGDVVSPEYEPQVVKAFENLRFALDAAGAKPSDVVKTTVLIVNLTDDKLTPFGREFQKLWPFNPPANTLIPVPRLAFADILFEIEAYAVIPDND